jgi:hypothetical protein
VILGFELADLEEPTRVSGIESFSIYIYRLTKTRLKTSALGLHLPSLPLSVVTASQLSREQRGGRKVRSMGTMMTRIE